MNARSRRAVAYVTQPGHATMRIYVHVATEGTLHGALGGARQMFLRPTARITFDRELGAFRADELVGDWVLAPITDWTTEDEAEDLTRLYAAIRGLPVSRVDLPHRVPGKGEL